MTLTAYVAQFIRKSTLASVQSDVVHLAKRSILDGLGLALAGSRSAAGRIAQDHVREQSCYEIASVLGTPIRTIPRLAAFANGLAIHADDYDDTQLAVKSDRVYGLLTHPTAPVLPAVLALSERDDRSGADLLEAYLVGVEVETKVAEAISPRHYDDGFHSTATAGAIGSGAAAAKLLGFDEEAIARTLGLSASQAGGLRENFGTMTKPFHAGRAAESGVVAADLVARGFTAAPNILEAKRGYFSAAGGGYDAALIDGRLGSPWTFASPGVSIKPHPSGSLTHPGMWAMLELIHANDIRPDRVRHVTVGTNRHMPNALIHLRPENELQAKFSMAFCMAILLLERRAGLAQFTDEVVARPDVKDLVARIDHVVDPEAEAAGYQNMTTIIRVELTDGRTLEARAAFGKGSPKNPMTDAELVEKFFDCAAWAGASASAARGIADRVMSLERERSVRALVAAIGNAMRSVAVGSR
jgi:2-methylcitrate dehydratase PrpD